jgi:hypothetical protein
MKKSLLLFVLSSLFVMLPVYAYSAGPVLFFSDLDSAPKTGWEGSTTKGAAVTVWGKNFGSTRGSNYVTVNGAQITEYAEWGTTGTANGIPRGLERITFWLNSNCANGAGTISVAVGGVTSNTLPFTTRSGNIYFVAPTGNDSNSGRSTSAPWQHLQKFTDLAPGDILYARGGEYTSLDYNGNSAHVMLYNTNGAAGSPIALVGYPAETPYINATRSGGGYMVRQSDWSGTTSSYLVFAKLKAVSGSPTMFQIIGDYIRLIGNWAKDLNIYGATGTFNTDNSRYVYMYGNYFEHCGTDNWQHAVYGKTKSAIPGADTSYQYFAYNEVNQYVDNLGPHGCGGGILDYSRESDAGAKTTHHLYIHSNLFINSGAGLFYTEGGVASYPVNNIYIYNNLIVNGTTCNAGTDGQLYFDGDVSSFYVFNNTFYKSSNPTAGALVTRYDYGSPSVNYRNNIFFTKNSSQPYFVYDGTGQTYSSHDLYFNAPVPSSGRDSILTAITSNPLFVSEAGLDFHLQASSPAINAGVSDSVMSPLLTADYDGNPRPQGSGYDIGAYEFTSGYIPPPVDTIPPSPPGNLRVQ